MNCPRCGCVVYYESFQSSEFSISCNLCGYYSAKIMSGTSPEGVPFFEYPLLEPKGVVVTTEGHLQYFSTRQRNQILKEKECKGYSYNENGKWKFQPINSVPVKLNSPAAFSLM